MNFDVLTSFSDVKFAVRAYANHLESVRSNYQKLNDLISAAAITDPEDLNGVTPASYFSALCGENEFDAQAYITLPQGEFTLIDLLVDIYNGSEAYSNGSESSEIDFTIDDNDSNPVSYTSVIDGLVSTLHSITAAWAASASALEDSVSARLSLFRDKMQTIFADAYDDISNSVEYWSKLLSENFTAADWIQTAMISMDIQRIADEEVAINESTLYEYTGASPVGALDFSVACNVAGTVGAVALTAYIGICKGIIALGNKIFQWGKQKLIEVVSDPDDLYVSDSAASEPACNDGYWVGNNCSADLPITANYYDLTNVFYDIDQLNHYLVNVFNPHYANKWIHLKLLCGELFIKILGLGTYSNRINLIYDYKYRPYVLDYNKVNVFGQASGAPGQWNTNYNLAGGYDIDTELTRLAMLQTADIYADSNTTEVDKLNGLKLGFEWLSDIMVSSLEEATSMNTFHANLYSRLRNYSVATSATNADFVQWCTGYKYDNNQWVYQQSVLENSDSVPGLILAFMLHCYDKFHNPLNYSFYPYTKDSESFSKGQWSIKTNSQNWEAFNTFGTTAVYAAIIVVAAIYAGVKISKWKKAKYLKRASFIGSIDNKMWTGQPISTSEWNKYIKYTRKLNVSNLMESRLTRVKESVDSIKDRLQNLNSSDNQTRDNLDSVKRLITG